MLTALPLAFLLSLLSPATYEFLLARTMLLRLLLLLAPLLPLLSPTLPLAVSGAVTGAAAAAGAGIIVV
jgi:hypothetical protein